MGFMQWLRGGDDTTSAMLSAGLAEIDALFRPSKHKQTEHIEETKRRRIDVANGSGIDLDRGIAIIRTSAKAEAPEAAGTAEAPEPPRQQPPREGA